jgi:hypothetical protein
MNRKASLAVLRPAPGEREIAPAAPAAVPAVPANVAAPAGAGDGAVDALRRRLGGGTSREHVVLDFLEDDLREARTALTGVAAWLANVEIALGEGSPSKYQILALALGGKPGDRVEELSSALASVRRRLAQVAARM